MKNKELKYIVDTIKTVSEALGLDHPAQLTQTQLLGESDIKEWMLRKNGGLRRIKSAYFPMEEKNVAESRRLQNVNRYISKLERDLGDKQLFEERIINSITESIKGLKAKKIKLPKVRTSKKKKKMTMEVMVADIHFGKKSEVFDLEICRSRIKNLTQIFIEEFKDNQKSFNVERIIIALLGDFIESFSMHGLESAAGCEFGNAKQIDEAINSLFFDLILPIAKLGVTIDIPAVTGNHDRTERSRTFINPGENNLTWIIYNVLEKLTVAYGLKNITFYTPKTSYVVLDIYNNNALYEHGDNARANTKKGFEDLMDARARQSGAILHFGRFGHYHEYSCYDRGRIIVTESICGQDSFAKVKGYKSSVGQTINSYVETKKRPTCFYRSFPVYLE